MANNKAATTETSGSDTSEEARHLAEEAVEERRRGNEDEANFVLNEARALDPAVVEDVVKSRSGK